MVTPLGEGQFTFALVRRTSKWETGKAGTGRLAHVGKTVTPDVITAAGGPDDFAHVGKRRRPSR